MVRFVVMGAGKASRMGQDKLAMPWGDTTILGYVLGTVIHSVKRLDTDQNPIPYEIQVIARKPITEFHLDPHLERLVKDQLQWIQVSSPQPLANTVHSGLSGLSEGIRGICFIPGDQVGLDSSGLIRMTQFFLEKTPDFLVPQAGEVTGSPVFFHHRYVSDLMSLHGEQGGRKVLEKYPERWTMYSVEPDFFLDVDTPEEYRAYQSEKLHK